MNSVEKGGRDMAISTSLNRRHQGHFTAFREYRVPLHIVMIHREEEAALPAFQFGPSDKHRLEKISQRRVCRHLPLDLRHAGDVLQDRKEKNADGHRFKNRNLD